MASVDETLASWTAWSEDIKSQLNEAKTAVENLKATDAAEDAAQAEALLNEVEAKVQAAYETATSTPETPDSETPETPADPNAPHPDQTLPGDLPSQ